jgi:hypothetical protein
MDPVTGHRQGQVANLDGIARQGDVVNQEIARGPVLDHVGKVPLGKNPSGLVSGKTMLSTQCW